MGTRSACAAHTQLLAVDIRFAGFCSAVLTAILLKVPPALGAGLALVLAIDVSAA